MKNDRLPYLGNLSRRSVAYFLLSVLFIPVLVYSCRKIEAVPNEYKKPPIDIAAVITKNDLFNWYDQLPAPEKDDLGIEAGLKNGTGKLPFPLQWNKAQQRIINGKHVVKVPVSKDAVMMFVKEGRNGVINAYAYKWLDKTKSGENFSGEVARFNFQDFKLHRVSYLNGKAVNASKFVFKNAPTSDQIIALKNELAARKRQFSGRKIKVTDFGDWLAGVFDTIGNTIGAIGCALIGGSWTNCGGTYSNSNCADFAMSCPMDGNPEPDTLTAGISDADYFAPAMFTVTNSNTGSTSGDGSSSSNLGSGSGSSSALYASIGNLSDTFWSTFSLLSGGMYGLGLGGTASTLSYDLDVSVRPCVGEMLNSIKFYAMIGSKISSTFGIQSNDPSALVENIIYNVANTPNHRLKFLEEDLGLDLDGTPINAKSLGVSIRLSPTYLSQASNLSIARTMIHEIVHTYFLWEINDHTIDTTDPSWIEFQNENQILFSYGTNGSDANSQHMQIALKYVSGIAAMLYDYAYGNKIAKPGWYTGTLQEYCNDMAWGGLEKTDIFQQLDKDSSTRDQYNRIMKVIAAETNDPDTYHQDPTTWPATQTKCN